MEQTTRTVQTGSAQAAALPPLPRLYQVHCPRRGVVIDPPFHLAVGRTTLGRRSTEGPVVVLADDPGISRAHAVLHVAPRSHALSITDQSGQNSSWRSGLRLPRGEDTPLRHGDVLRVGDSVLVVCSAEEPPEHRSVQGLLGRSALIARLAYELSRVARSRLTVLLLGEPGVGKERAARGLQALSERRTFKALDCGALQGNLIESELFGHVRGAFSGALTRRRGALEEAHEGVLFLDEVGNLPLDLQVKFLRALQERRACPVGGQSSDEYSFDIMLVAATNQDLRTLISAGRFKADLYSRIAGIELRLPPLRERREDLLLLLQRATLPGGSTAELPPLSASQVELLLLHRWPANVRDLLFVGEHLRTLGFDDNLRRRLAAQPSGDAQVAPAAASAEAAPAPGERPLRAPKPSPAELEALLRKHEGRLLRIQREIGWDRRTLRDLVHEYGLAERRLKDE